MPTFLEKLLAESGVELPLGFVLKKFKPCTLYIKGLDWFFYLEKDCSYLEQWIPDSNIALLFDAHNPEQLVGIRIEQFSSLVPPAVIKILTDA